MLKEVLKLYTNPEHLNRTAIIDLSTPEERHYTFQEIENLVTNLTRFLLNKQFLQGTKIGILGVNSVKFVVAYFAIRRAGHVVVPINYKLPVEQIQYICNDSETKFIFSDAEFSQLCPSSIEHTLLEFNVSEPATIPERDVNRPALILYTSGSTGRPKGVVIHHNKRQWWLKQTCRFIPNHVALLSAPLYHQNGLSNIETGLSCGYCTVLMPTFDTKVYANAITKFKVTILLAVPPMLAMVLNDQDAIKDANFESVQFVNLGSAPTSEKLFNDIQTAFKNAKVILRYGSTEAGASLFGFHPTLATPPMSVGYPRPGVECKIINGVLHIRHAGLLSSYNNNQDLYNDSFTPDGFYNTKDLFRVDENGFYFFVGRDDDMFKSGGNTIIPAEIQNVLESHHSVSEGFVIGLDDEIKGMKPYAFVVLSGMSNEDELLNYAAKHLAPYQIPRRIWAIDHLPLTDTNKIDKKQLSEIAKQKIAQDI